MFTRYRYPLLAVFSLTLLGAAPLAQAHDRHVDISLNLPHLAISSRHDHDRYPEYYPPQVVAHYHGGQLCHLRHEAGYGYDHGRPYYERHRHGHYDRY